MAVNQGLEVLGVLTILVKVAVFPLRNQNSMVSHRWYYRIWMIEWHLWQVFNLKTVVNITVCWSVSENNIHKLYRKGEMMIPVFKWLLLKVKFQIPESFRVTEESNYVGTFRWTCRAWRALNAHHDRQPVPSTRQIFTLAHCIVFLFIDLPSSDMITFDTIEFHPLEFTLQCNTLVNVEAHQFRVGLFYKMQRDRGSATGIKNHVCPYVE